MCSGRLRGFARELTHLLCYYRKPFSGRARPGCLHRGIQRQYIGLKRDIFDRFQYFLNLVRAVLDLVHRLHERLHLLIAQRNFLARMMCLTAECHSAVRRLLCLIRDLRDL